MNSQNLQLFRYFVGLIIVLLVVKRITPNDTLIESPPICCEGNAAGGDIHSPSSPAASPSPTLPPSPTTSPPIKTCSEKSNDFEKCSKHLTWKVQSEEDIDKLVTELQQCYQNSGGLCDDDQRQFNNLIYEIKNQKSRIQGHRQKMIRDCESAAFRANAICKNVALHTGGDVDACESKYKDSMDQCSVRSAYCFFQVNKFTLEQVLCQ